MVPVLMQTPPTMSRLSTTAARLPSLAVAMAAFCPPGPPLHGDGALQVAQLPAVVVAAVVGGRPAEEDVARRLHQPLPAHHPVAVVALPAWAEVLLQHRGGRLLELDEQRVAMVPAG